MITTDFIPGSPCWLDLGAVDVPATASFYSAVFGWEFQPLPEDPDNYGAFRLGGDIVAGIGKLTEKGARSAWMVYFHTPDAEATAREVERLGGTVRTAPADAGEAGRMAQLTDPQGGQFAVWQPRGTQGFDIADQPGALSWTELYTTDSEGAKQFYGGLFGWTAEDMHLPGEAAEAYTILTPAGGDQDRMHGGMMQLPAEHLTLTNGRPYWHPVFAVTDTDAALEALTRHGGSVQMGPEDAEGVGRLAVCLDPSGADFVVLTPSPTEAAA